MKHKVKMLSTQPGVHDGELHPVMFHEGQEYHVGPDLLQGFVNLGAVELVDGEDAAAEKSEGDAPENKAIKAAPENKGKKK